MTVSNAFSAPDQLSADLRERILAAAAELGLRRARPGGPRPGPRHDRRRRRAAHRLAARTPSPTRSRPASSAPSPTSSRPTGLALTLLTSDGPRRRRGARPRRRRWTARSSTRAASSRRRRLADPPRAAARLRRPGSRSPASRASTSTTAAAPAPPPSTSSTSATAGSAIVNRRARAWPDEVVASRHRRQARVAPAAARLARAADGRGHRAAHRRGRRLDRGRDHRRAAQPRRRPRRDPGALQRDDRPTAILCFSDVMAFRVVRIARGAGPAGARGPLGHRLRRQSAGQPDAPRPDHRAAGRPGEGAGSRGGAHRRDRGRPRGTKPSRAKRRCRPSSSCATAPRRLAGALTDVPARAC